MTPTFAAARAYLDEIGGFPANPETAGYIRGLVEKYEELCVMLEELTDASECLALYPEGAVGIEDLRETQHRARALLDREKHTSGDRSA